MITWRKSSRSADAGQCVEVRGDLAALRDSKNLAGPELSIGVRSVVLAVKTGRFDR